ncbi:MAG: class I SAM-dependent methyltransferase [Anaerolineae bacterium]|nr:class I SAM-dependent methyltransferase [Anaerolineae bacterium]MDH7475219.1 class I SAM-dependent methyltransferase [Anaerolineae bacterium]
MKQQITMTSSAQTPPVCDYEGSGYRTDFWEGKGREYEDLVERIALRRLLPPRGQCLLEIGAGFGRLTELYAGFEQIVLLDYSKSQLRQAQERLGRSERYTYVAADFYNPPFVDSLFDGATLIRTIHHAQDVPLVLQQIRRVLAPAGTFILEFANKRHLKAIIRYWLHHQTWNPFDPQPFEFAELNFDFHPQWMTERLREADFIIERRLTVSHFRVPWLKRCIPPRLLAAADGLVQWTGEWWQLSPSVFVRARQGKSGPPPSPDGFFRCPRCGGKDWQHSQTMLACQTCGARWAIDDGIYDFKSSLD